MKNFEHLKGKFESLEDFIEDANNDPRAKEAKKKINKKNALLIVIGKGNRIQYSKPTLISIKKDIQKDMEYYCSGSKQGVINFLLRHALNDLIEKKELIIEDI